MADLERLIAVARGDGPADLVLRGGTVLDVVTGDLIAGDVALVGETIASVGPAASGPVRDVTGHTTGARFHRHAICISNRRW